MNVIKSSFQDDIVEERLSLGMQLAAAIGILNACTYIVRGKVFASSQSGNLLYLGMDLAQGNFDNIVKYLFPVLLFGIGIALGEHFHSKYKSRAWRIRSTICESVLIVIATLMPVLWSLLANPIFGLACGLQSISFHHFHHADLATIYIAGNIQHAIEYFTRYLHIKNTMDFAKGVLYILIISAHLLGIVVGAFLTRFLHQYVSLLTAVMLLAILIQLVYCKDHKEDFQKKQSV